MLINAIPTLVAKDHAAGIPHENKAIRRIPLLEAEMMASVGFGMLAAAYVFFIVLVARVVGFNHLEDE